jgi:hypothetical protein
MTTDKIEKNEEMIRLIFDTLATIIRLPPSGSTDSQRLSLVVIRTTCRKDYKVHRH